MKAWQTTRKFGRETLALLTAGLLASVLAAPALSQGTAPAASGSVPCSPSLLPGSPGTPTTGAAESHNPAPPPDNLSERLAQSGGVICPPPAVDPGIKLPTPDTGRTPVIPPPGSPGGDPSVRPK